MIRPVGDTPNFQPIQQPRKQQPPSENKAANVVSEGVGEIKKSTPTENPTTAAALHSLHNSAENWLNKN